MSSNYWQTMKHGSPFKHGKTLTQRVKEYETVWMTRCYSDGLPDDVPNNIQKSGRAPSYKAIAIAILKNDMQLKSLGFAPVESELCRQLRHTNKKNESPQTELF